MKKILLLTTLCILLAAPAFGQVTMWINVLDGTPTLHWDAVTTTIDNTTIPATEVVKYEVFLANAITDPGKTNPARITTNPITTLEMSINLGSTEGKFLPGVRSVRTLNGEVLSYSTISWSDNVEVVDGDPFGLMLYISPKGPRISITSE